MFAYKTPVYVETVSWNATTSVVRYVVGFSWRGAFLSERMFGHFNEEVCVLLHIPLFTMCPAFALFCLSHVHTFLQTQLPL